MARPLSEQKRKAILCSAAKMIASLGTSASTAKIAEAAGVAEGTLFTYFATKEVLLNQLLLEIETGLAQVLTTSTASLMTNQSPRERVQCIWNCLIEWGKTHPVQRRAMRQLKASERMSDETRRRCNALFSETRKAIEDSLEGYADPKRTSFYIEHVLMGLAEVVIEAMTADSQGHKNYKQAGFDLFWQGIKS